MTKHLTLKNHHYEKTRFYYRLLFVGLLIALLTTALIARLVYLQIDKNKLYTTLSQKNQLSVLPIAPNRGLIYDRHGILLADNIPTFNLSITPEKISNIEKTIKTLQQHIKISEEDKQQFYQLLEQRRRFDKVPLRIKLSEEEVAKFYLNQHHFPGVSVNAELIRYYPHGEASAAILGYVGRINRDDTRYLNDENYLATQYVGKLGIEKHYENILHGTVGYQQVETNANGRIVRVVKQKPASSGKNLYLTIDYDLQQTAQDALTDHRGAVVAIDPNNGEILALASNPSYDPNLFVQGMSRVTFNNLQQDTQQPLFNRAIRGQYALASTIKPFLALMALNEGVTTLERRIQDPGVFQLPNSQHKYRDWKRKGHGWINLSDAITVSCDIYFYELAMKLGIKNINIILRHFAFGQATGIDVDEELSGLIPTPEWKYGHHGVHWYPGDTILSGIGQGYMLATPLQLSTAAMGLANRGFLYKPHLLKQIQTDNNQFDEGLIEPLSSVVIPYQYWQIVIQAMQNVIQQPHGTGFRFGRTPYTIAAKTGTAQVVRIKDDKTKNNVASRHKDNSIFIAFAPVEQPQIAVAVVIENNSDAILVARKVLDHFFQSQKKANA